MSDEQSTKKRRPWWHWALSVAGTGSFIWLLIWGPWLIEDRHLRDNKDELVPSAGIIITGLRTAFIAVAAGAFTAAGLWYTHRSHQHTVAKDLEQARLALEDQITGRYVEAIKLLDSEHMAGRLGGIYALERIMKDSEKDRSTIVEVLSAFIRGRLADADGFTITDEDTLLRAEFGPRCKRDRTPKPRPLSLEVASALKVLTRRPDELRQAEPTDLRSCQLAGYDLASLDLRWANLRRANLQAASLKHSHLHDAQLDGADLRYTDLSGAHLPRATLRSAELDGAYLWHTDLTNAIGLSVATLALAYVYRETKLPGSLSGIELRLAHRIKDCEEQAAEVALREF